MIKRNGRRPGLGSSSTPGTNEDFLDRPAFMREPHVTLTVVGSLHVAPRRTSRNLHLERDFARTGLVAEQMVLAARAVQDQMLEPAEANGTANLTGSGTSVVAPVAGSKRTIPPRPDHATSWATTKLVELGASYVAISAAVVRSITLRPTFDTSSFWASKTPPSR